MDINVAMVPYILILTGVLPALFAIRLAKKQQRSMLTSGVVTFALGFTWIGGWIYLGIMNFKKPV
jgi:heme/copper-type cytochrome/quinol oxidase subunit 3